MLPLRDQACFPRHLISYPHELLIDTKNQFEIVPFIGNKNQAKEVSLANIQEKHLENDKLSPVPRDHQAIDIDARERCRENL